MNGEELMLRAIELAERNASSVTGGPFGAVVVKDGKVITEASNTVTVDNDPTAHAEVNAIRKACAALGTSISPAASFTPAASPVPCAWPHATGRISIRCIMLRTGRMPPLQDSMTATSTVR